MDYSKKMPVFTVLVWMLIAIFSTTVAKAAPKARCEVGHYLDNDSKLCLICSQCSVNEIIREPCGLNHDTVCGPFYEFEFFNQGPSNSDSSAKKKTKDFNLFKIRSTEAPSGGKDQQTADRVFSDGPSVQDESMKWKELCYGLIASLVVLALVFAAYVIFAQVQISKLQAKAKAMNSQDSSEETVYCYTQILNSVFHGSEKKRRANSSRGANPQRALNPIYRPGQARRVTNQPIRASPNEYVIQIGQSKEEVMNAQEQLLPVIPEGGASEESDHVRVLYTS